MERVWLDESPFVRKKHLSPSLPNFAQFVEKNPPESAPCAFGGKEEEQSSYPLICVCGEMLTRVVAPCAFLERTKVQLYQSLRNPTKQPPSSSSPSFSPSTPIPRPRKMNSFDKWRRRRRRRRRRRKREKPCKRVLPVFFSIADRRIGGGKKSEKETLNGNLPKIGQIISSSTNELKSLPKNQTPVATP